MLCMAPRLMTLSAMPLGRQAPAPKRRAGARGHSDDPNSGLSQGLIQVGQDVVDMLDADRKSDIARGDAGAGL